MNVILNELETQTAFQLMKTQNLKKMDESQERDSKWTLIIIHHLEININQYKPLRGSNYVALPEEIIR
jgi:hypothetical protein